MIAFAIPRKELGTRSVARNREIERCLQMNPTYIFMVDADQTMPNRGLSAMYATGADITVIDSPNKGYDDSNVRYHPDGTLAYTGLSCVLFKATIFEKLEKPYFSSEYAWIEQGIVEGKITWRIDKKYQDDNEGEELFFLDKAQKAGLTIAIVPDLKCKHFQLQGV